MLRIRLAFLVVAAALWGCTGANENTDFPLSVGYQPLESASDAPLPAKNADGTYPQGLGEPIVAGDSHAGYFFAHARGYILAPLATVYTALQDPMSLRIHNTGTYELKPGVEGADFPISYRIRYTDSTIVGVVRYEVTYRGGPFPVGAAAADMTSCGARYQKTWGTEHIRVMSGSLVATPTADDPNVTEVDMVAWLSADTQGIDVSPQTLRDLFGDLTGVIAALP
ncbi:MAG TPA: hypothetical protein VML50_15080 [Anaeromyxobacter sp.]|nr:hypothetical protein [Anaeromyxobacter sp.]